MAREMEFTVVQNQDVNNSYSVVNKTGQAVFTSLSKVACWGYISSLKAKTGKDLRIHAGGSEGYWVTDVENHVYFRSKKKGDCEKYIREFRVKKERKAPKKLGKTWEKKHGKTWEDELIFEEIADNDSIAQALKRYVYKCFAEGLLTLPKEGRCVPKGSGIVRWRIEISSRNLIDGMVVPIEKISNLDWLQTSKKLEKMTCEEIARILVQWAVSLNPLASIIKVNVTPSPKYGINPRGVEVVREN